MGLPSIVFLSSIVFFCSFIPVAGVFISSAPICLLCLQVGGDNGVQLMLIAIAFILVIASLVQFSQIVMRATQPLLHEVLGIFVPLITTNCAVLGVALLNSAAGNSFAHSIIYGFGAAVGFSGLLVVFAAINERLVADHLPAPFRGSAIKMITAGILSLGFMGFTGISP